MGRCIQIYQTTLQLQSQTTVTTPSLTRRTRVRNNKPRLQKREKSNPTHAVKRAPPRKRSTSIKGMLQRESDRNNNLHGEIKMLRVTLEANRKKIVEKSRHIELKNEKIKDLVDIIEKHDNESYVTEGDDTNYEDIDSLLKANFGFSNVNDIVKMTEANFPIDLLDLDFSNENLHSSAVTVLTQPSELPQECNSRCDLMRANNSKSWEVKQETNHQCKIEDNRSGAVHGDGVYNTKVSLDARTVAPTDSNESHNSESNHLLCPYCVCSFPYGDHGLLQKHMHRYHDFQCQHCNKQFRSMSILIAHSRRHRLYPFMCKECGYKPEGLESYVKHVKSAHEVTSIEGVKKLLLLANCQL